MHNNNLGHEILALLPKNSADGRYQSTKEIHEKLLHYSARDAVSQRTVLRALERLLDIGVVESKKSGVSLFWRQRAGANGIKVGAMMTHGEALALQTLKRFASRQIPTLVADGLTPLFDIAAARLKSVNNQYEQHYIKWSSKVEIEAGNFALIYPVIDPRIFTEVSQALFSERTLEIVYRSRSKADAVSTKIVSPLGLVEVGGLIYLVASVPKYQNPATYRLDRLQGVTMRNEKFDYPPDFFLADYVKQQRQFDFMVEGEIDLKLRFTNGAGDHLLETPMSMDQVAKRLDDVLEIEGSVLLSQRLRWWLRAFGSSVEVVEPAKLRAEFAHEARTAVARYGN